MHHLGNGVCAQHLVYRVRRNGDHELTVVHQHGRHVGQVELARAVRVAQLAQALEKRVRAEGVDAAVDLAEALRLGQQVRRERLLLHDGFHVTGAVLFAQHAAITGRVGRNGGQDGHGRVILQVRVAQPCDGLRTNERHIAGQHQQMLRCSSAGVAVPVAHALQCVAGAQLLRLQDELYTSSGRRGLYLFRLVAHHHRDAVCRNDRLCRCNHVQQQRPAAHLVQHLGPRAAQAGALARSHDDYAKLVRRLTHQS